MSVARCALAFGDNADGRCARCGSRSRACAPFCSRACRDEWRRDHVWPAARLATLTADEWHCSEIECSADDWSAVIEVHHEVPVKDRGGYSPGCQHHREGLRSLCEAHHRRAERRGLRFTDGRRGWQRRLRRVA
jgi:hypothetical protein